MNFSQFAFGLFSFKIYALFLAIAFVVGSILYYKELQKRNFSTDFFLQNYWKWILFGIFIGRLFVAIPQAFELFERNGLFFFFAFWDGEISFIGLIAGFIAAMIYHLKQKKIDFYRWIDALILPALIGIMILDIGGFITGQVYGIATTLPWGVQYETFSVDILTPIHPVTLYGLVFHFWLFAWAKKHAKVWDIFSGKLAFRIGILFFIGEFFLQFLRGDHTVMIWIFRFEHFLILGALALLYVVRLQRKKEGLSRPA